MAERMAETISEAVTEIMAAERKRAVGCKNAAVYKCAGGMKMSYDYGKIWVAGSKRPCGTYDPEYVGYAGCGTV